MVLRNINLNLLPVLSALLREKNVTRAAAAVGLSQPAASKALAELRATLDDPLLVRSGRQLVLTPRAEALAGEVDALCAALEALWLPEHFDPLVARRDFVIDSSDYAPILIVPPIAPLLAALSPKLSMRFRDLAIDNSSSNVADFWIAPRQLLELERDILIVPMFRDEFVPVVLASHALAGSQPTRAAIDASPHVTFWGGPATGPFGDGIEALVGGKPERIVAAVQHFSALPLLAVLVGAVAITPRRLAEILAIHLPIVILDEGEARARVEICLAWPRRLDSDPAHRWFRTLIIDTMSDDRFAD